MAGKKVLIVSYYWYPFAGVGTYRISRFVKYLLKSGWDVVILTTKEASSGMKDEPDDPILNQCKVYRSNIIEPTELISSGNKDSSKTSNPSIFYQKDKDWKSKLAVWARLNLMIPDAKFTWKWFAVPMGKKIIKEENPDLILSTSPPPTTNLIAKKLANWSGLPWLADFRDPWTNIYYYDDNPQSPRARKKNNKLEAKTLRAADHITLVNNGFFPEHEEKIADKSTVIPNGFDPDHIIKTERSSSKNNKFTIRYFGSLKANQYPSAFIEALKEIEENHPKKARDMFFEFFGSIDPNIKNEIISAVDSIEVNFQGYIPHDEMMERVQSADLLLLVIGKTKNSIFVLSTKIFEYMTSENPILGIGPLNGSAAQLVQKANIGQFFSHQDSKGIQEYILQLVNEELEISPNQEVINQYDFRYLTHQLEQIMDDLITA
ncbi:glycosyltransferase [Gracilimonas sp.]|uniref:glycosyltransferase n=1 Tax=Gracilimonas sp. TaxID=1974203 RepID=UPI00287108F9|nr:glycosyltransferase [Gracilimonas sp.]